LLQQFDTWARAQQGDGPHVAALLEIASLKGQHRKEIESRYIDMFKRIRQILRDGIADGSMRAFEPTSATRAIIGANEWIFSWLHSIPADQVASAAKEAMDIISRGLYAGRGEFAASDLSYAQYKETGLPGFDREEQNRLKQEAFYKTGTWYFNKQGFNGTSLDEIAEHLNVSKGAFYYHIKNKEDLLYNCYSRSLDIIEKIHQEVSQADTTGLQKIAQTCRMIFQVQNSSEGPLIRYNTITALPMDRRLQILQRTDSNNECFGEFMRQGMADGSVRPINVTIAENLIAGAVNASMDISLWRAVDDLDAAAIDYFDIFFNGLLPRD
jgi:AcrR family transcriptional regulator